MKSIPNLRREYALATLDEASVDKDPFAQFRHWMEDALRAKAEEPTAMALATATRAGLPSVRIVLLKGVDEAGFVFFTDHQSQKGRELETNPRAALCLFWRELERQVRISGSVVKLEREEVETYFATRPIGSRIGAWASVQSSVLQGRAELERKLAEVEQRFAGREPHAPPNWGGYRVIPDEFEFWQGRESRLHDRLLFQRSATAAKTWSLARLSP